MAINTGIWIDHHKAVVCRLTGKTEDIREIMSDVDNPTLSPNGAPTKNAYTRNDFVAEDRREHKIMNHLNSFYDEVIKHIHDSDFILIMGPGEAKGEFEKRIATKKLRGHVAEVQTVDKLTDRQIAEHVRKHYQ